MTRWLVNDRRPTTGDLRRIPIQQIIIHGIAIDATGPTRLGWLGNKASLFLQSTWRLARNADFRGDPIWTGDTYFDQTIAALRFVGKELTPIAKLNVMNAPFYDRSVGARAFDRNLRRRTSSGPADSSSAQQAGHMTAGRPNVCNVKKLLVNRGRSLIAFPLSMFFCRRPGSRFSPRSEQSAATSGPKHRCCNVHNELAYNDAAQGPLSQPPVPSPGGQPSHPQSCSDES
jgi:hypothetical protein